MSEKEIVISLNEVKKSFDGKVVLNGVTFDVGPGETMVIMGGSGCGKSTLLRMIIGAIQPDSDSGHIKMLGQNVMGATEMELNQLRLKYGILFQSGALFQSMTIAENVALPLQEHTDLDEATIDIMVKIKLELVGLREHAEKFPAQISGGMKKRAGIARALALDPRLLFYDEPSAGLDPVTSAEIDQLMVDLTKKLGVTSVVVTHEMDSAFTIADRMVMLDKGRVLAIESKEWFDTVQNTDPSELDEDKQLIRQFLRGEAEGPITQRKQTTNYAEDLLGTPEAPSLTPKPSIVASRRV
jgi:phospholipid/cholesterol/gamma-HCH transport system ATP-binding protein